MGAVVQRPIPDLRHLKRFIAERITGHTTFNEHSSRRAHAGYIIDAAKALGFTVRKIGSGYFLFRADGHCIGSVDSLLTSLVSSAALKIARSKKLTGTLLTSAGVPTPRGQVFSVKARDLAHRYFTDLGRPAVVKPVAGRGGEGVTCGITATEHFNAAWKTAAGAVGGAEEISVEEFVTGVDLRVFVVGDNVAAAATRLPAFVVGDGSSSIRDLIDAQQARRNRNVYLAEMPITVDTQWLVNCGYALDSCPAPGEIIVLNPTVNLHQGGSNADVSELLHPELQEIAIRARRAIPGLGAAGIDLIARSPEDPEGAVVLEVNCGANILVHHLPAYGEPVDVGRALVEQMAADAAAA